MTSHAMNTWIRRHRWAVALTALWLLVAQVMVSAYACPRIDDVGSHSARRALENAPEPVPGPVGSVPCAQHGPQSLDPGQPWLCRAHCDADAPAGASASSALDLPTPLWVAAFGPRPPVVPVGGRARVLAPFAAAEPLAPAARPRYLVLLALRY